MINNSYLASPAAASEGNPPVVLGSPTQLPGRRPLRHILIGNGDDVAQTVRLLHVLNYAEQFRWSSEIIVPDSGILVPPHQGEGLRYLVRWQPPCRE